VATGAAGIVVLLLLWQAAAMILNDQVALPSVAQTVQQFLHYLDHPYPTQGKPIWFDLYISLQRIVIGFVIGVTVGVALGATMSASLVLRHLVDPSLRCSGRCRRSPSSRCSSSGWASARCPRKC
jgi:taurine transport system permease protein